MTEHTSKDRPMPDFKFALGEIVIIDPTGAGRGPEGKVVGQVSNLDGSRGYMVSTSNFARDGCVVRHYVSEHEICAKGARDDD